MKKQRKHEPELTREEAASLRPVLQAVSRRTGRPTSLGVLLRKWTDLTREVQRGYELTVYDYTNDLSVRDFLEEIIEHASGAARPKIIARISETDQAFRDATREVGDAVLGDSRANRGWWWRRLPARMGDEMLRDLDQ